MIDAGTVAVENDPEEKSSWESLRVTLRTCDDIVQEEEHFVFCALLCAAYARRSEWLTKGPKVGETNDKIFYLKKNTKGVIF